MSGKSCFFIGHRNAEEALFQPISALIGRHIVEFGVSEFTVGGYGAFDGMAARAVLEAKKRHPEIRLFLLLPYHPSDRPPDLPPGFDGSFFPPGMETVPKRLAIVRANRYMVDYSGYLIAYAWRPASNALKLAEYARKREKQGLLTVSLLQRP